MAILGASGARASTSLAQPTLVLVRTADAKVEAPTREELGN